MISNTEHIDIKTIKDKIRKKLRMDILEIDQVFDEESGTYTEQGKEYTEAYLKGIEAGKLKISLELAFKALDMLEFVKHETGLTLEELRFLKEPKKEV